MAANTREAIDIIKHGIVVGLGVVVLVLAGISAGYAADWTGFLNINTAVIEDLLKLPDMDQETARSIVAYRESHGAFSSPEDLIHVDGFSYKKIDVLRPYVRCDGPTILAETHSTRLMRNIGELLDRDGY